MIVESDATLAKYRAMPCAWCGARAPSHPHHALATRGFGGGTRLDADCNLLPLCGKCHDGAHAGKMPGMVAVCHEAVEKLMLVLIAHREGKTPEVIEATIHQLLWRR